MELRGDLLSYLRFACRENHPVLSWKRSREMTSRQAGGDPERNKPRAAAGFSRNFQPVATSKEGILSVRKKSPLPRSVQRERAAASGEGWRRHTYAHVHTCTRTLAHLHRRTYCKHQGKILPSVLKIFFFKTQKTLPRTLTLTENLQLFPSPWLGTRPSIHPAA